MKGSELFKGGHHDYLYGDNGDDQQYGGLGSDSLYGSAGADLMDGGDGRDFARYSSSSAAVTINLAAGLATGGDAEGDTFNSIEVIFGSVYNDMLTGDAGINEFFAGNGDDTLFGGDGNDKLNGMNGEDIIYGGDGVDYITGGNDDDQQYGELGDDRIFGGAGADLVDGGAGYDTADYWYSSAAVTIDLSAGTGTGGDADGDTFVSIEALVGTDYGDSLTGNSADNILEGGAGNDTLTGGSGNDEFIFVPGAGSDVITDFTAGTGLGDVIDIADYGTFTDLTGVVAAAYEDAGDVVIDLDASDTLRLSGLTIAELHADDFRFV